VADVFSSYSRDDVDFVHELNDGLVARGKDVWVDFEDIPLTSEWLEEVFEGIESSNNYLFVRSPDSVTSDVRTPAGAGHGACRPDGQDQRLRARSAPVACGPS
jgi:hypothetical protein